MITNGDGTGGNPTIGFPTGMTLPGIIKATGRIDTDSGINAVSDITARSTGLTRAKMGAVGPGGEAGIFFQNSFDTGLYRSATGTLKTDQTLHVGATFRHLGSQVGFYNVTAVSRPSAYTQTYATADKTHANFTSSDLATTAATQTTPWGFASQAQADNIATQVNAIRADLADLKQLVNAIIDDLQALGLVQ